MVVSIAETETTKAIVLASASAARTRLLHDAGVAHICDPADIDEAALKQSWTDTPQNLALVLAAHKARAVSARHPDAFVIGADQILALDDQIFDKPGTISQAAAQLKQLRGKSHALISAVVLVQNETCIWNFADQAHLTMRAFSDDFLNEYLETVGTKVVSSVGAYHLEGLGAQLFERIEGDYFTVLGLPLIPLLGELRRRLLITQ